MLDKFQKRQVKTDLFREEKVGTCLVQNQGDALLALWKVERKQLKNIITVVIKCSLEIHGLFETQESEEGLDIRVKIGKLWLSSS